MVCDSTCANQPGSSLSEADLYEGLYEHISSAEGRVIVTCFGSNIARLHTLSKIAQATGRHIGLLGRSLISTSVAARSSGLLPDASFVESEHLAYLPRETLLLVATGSQGEPRTALNRLSNDAFKDLSLDPGDTVIFSARAIPGNEAAIDSMVARLSKHGITVITPDTSNKPIHASGHPGEDELVALYGWIKPTILVPVHGEPEHQEAQVLLAKGAGIERQLNGQNGDLFIISPNAAIRRQFVNTSRLGLGKTALEKIPLPS